MTSHSHSPHVHPSGTDDPLLRRLEILLAVLLGLAALTAATAAYKGEVLRAHAITGFNKATQLSSDSNQSYSDGTQTLVQQEALFLEYAKAATADDTELAAYIRESLFTDELEKAVGWWEEQEGADQPTSPFVAENPEYRDPYTEKGDELAEETAAEFKKSKTEITKGDEYILVTVFIAAALFLYGISTVSHRLAVKIGTMAVGALIYTAAAVKLVELSL